MAIHVITKRKWHVGSPQSLLPLLSSLRNRALEQKGHLSSQILRRHEEEKEYVVLSRWESMEDWNSWVTSNERREIQSKIDSLIGEKTFFEVYELVDGAGKVIVGKR